MLHNELVNRTPRQIAFLSALLPQLLLAVLAPALVVCQEGAGGQSVELSVAECCGDSGRSEAPAESGQELRASDDECGDCLDASLNLSLLRGEDEASLDLCLCPVLDQPQDLVLPVLPSASHARAPPQRYLGVAPGLLALRTTRLLC